ncbi:MAG TPA: hypothetical protein VL200_07115 [Lacunisphaera sp.]|jgi:hypothetical protein|nr:hypothetical protein [Lacunisphaera sp.]
MIAPLTIEQVRRLDGATVLVRSAREDRNPPTALRGTVRAKFDDCGHPVVGIELDHPQMFSHPPKHSVILLDAGGIDRLLASHHEDTYDFTVDDDLVPDAEPFTPGVGE